MHPRNLAFVLAGVLSQGVQLAKANAETQDADARYLEIASNDPDALITASGMVIIQLAEGVGDSPKPTSRVKVNYRGTLTDGTQFDSSKPGKPSTFALRSVIACWKEGLQHMKVGGKSRLVCPADLAYGDRGSPPKIKPGAMLVFEVELVELL